jgi:hypothetical protein
MTRLTKSIVQKFILVLVFFVGSKSSGAFDFVFVALNAFLKIFKSPCSFVAHSLFYLKALPLKI